MQVSQEEYESKAKEINDSIFGADRKKKLKLMEKAKFQVDASAKFALEKALQMKGISQTERNAFISLLKEQKDAINILFVSGEQKEKSVDMLKPIFGYKGSDFIDTFQDVFKKLQVEVQLDMKRSGAS
ncbi:MAG TPA: hypothetical protein VJH23_06180 [archaeon]|nr:hypothetical protein [archaeon]